MVVQPASKKWQNLLFSKFFFLLTLAGLGVFATGVARAYYQEYKLREQIRQLESSISDMRAKKIESLDLLKYVMSDEYVEATARSQLNLKRPDEGVAIITNSGDETEIKEAGERTGQTISNPLKWWYYFVRGGQAVK